ncbi:MAG: iron ABC transporter permease [Acidobacteriota bacterium]
MQKLESDKTKEIDWRRGFILAIGIAIVTILASLLSLSLGPAQSSVLDLFSDFQEERSLAIDIICRVRLPRVILSILTGAALSVSGAALQAIMRNPLADPYILGISGGAFFGTFLFSLLSGANMLLSSLGRPFSAFFGAIATLVILIYLSRIKGRISSTSLLLIGVIINSFFTALILFLLAFTEFSRVQSSFFWIAGSIGSPDYLSLIFVAIFLITGLLTLLTVSRALNILSLGESTAFSLGVDVERVKLLSIVAASLMTAAAVSFAGLIGFVGLMIPHIFRLILGPDNRILLINCATGGALFLLACDTLGRIIMPPSEVPAGIMTAMAGCPFFIWLYLKEKGEKIEID